ncbi:PIR Superfamily Protein [Plasmodium ovale wallikeri]|uniref:PIR Superfamily Protein n=1 Tax=Plasmodium ovale wallikeri TaxID=864142 RepID=A0A1A9A796_PLAOA|nr:PIR Superfamily Protein [Plasmodium ovale wallikeri]SBT55519.1 PIR Superfamily Protein [Plasmodium ovale wallikeri]
MAETVESIVEKLNKFYAQMDEEVTEEKELLEKNSLNGFPYNILNETLNKITRNYYLYKSNNAFISKDKYCNYLNTWIYKKKSFYDNASSGKVTPDFHQKIIEHFSKNQDEIYSNLLECKIMEQNNSFGTSATRKKIDDLYYVRERLGGKETIKKKKSMCLDFNNYMYDTVCDIFKSVIPTNSDITLKKSDFARGINTHGNIFDIFTKISCEDERTLEDSGQFRDTKDQDNSLEIAGMQSDTYKKGTIKKNIHDTEIENTLEDTFDSLHVNVKQKDYSMSYIPVEEY